MAKLYHIKLDKKSLCGARVALLPGDPFRSERIAEEAASTLGGTQKRLAWNREYCTHLVRFRGSNVLVTSTGIGGPSTSIAVDELARLGVKTFIRVGTTGALKKGIKTGEAIITTGAVRLDGASTHYAPIEFPAVADLDVTNALVQGAKDSKIKYHTGISASSDTFYPGEERSDSFRRYTIRALRGSSLEWQRLGVLNYEMESSTLLTLTSSMGLSGGCVTGVVNRAGGGRITDKDLRLGEGAAIKTAVAALCHIKT